jgi:hypothetical protein
MALFSALFSALCQELDKLGQGKAWNNVGNSLIFQSNLCKMPNQCKLQVLRRLPFVTFGGWKRP